MQEPFPDELEPAFGLVTLRTIKGLPVWIVFLLGGGAVGPILVLGPKSWLAWVMGAVCLTGAGVVASWAKDDPQFLTAWWGELMLKRYYH